MKILEYIKSIIKENAFIKLHDAKNNYHVESEYKKTRINPDGSIEYDILVRVVITKK